MRSIPTSTLSRLNVKSCHLHSRRHASYRLGEIVRPQSKIAAFYLETQMISVVSSSLFTTHVSRSSIAGDAQLTSSRHASTMLSNSKMKASEIADWQSQWGRHLYKEWKRKRKKLRRLALRKRMRESLRWRGNVRSSKMRMRSRSA